MWSPTISLGAPVTIPEAYIPDLPTRLALYRRLSALEEDAEIDAMGAEIVDRFGPPPPEVALLLKLVTIKALCRRAHVEKLDAGAKGLTLAFRDNSFANPGGPGEMGGAPRPARARAPGHAHRRRRRIRGAAGAARRARWRSCARSPRSRRRRGSGGGAERGQNFPSLSKEIQAFPRKFQTFPSFFQGFPNVFLGGFQRNQQVGGDGGDFSLLAAGAAEFSSNR